MRGGRGESMRAREEERRHKVLHGSGQKEEGGSKVNHKHLCLEQLQKKCVTLLSLSPFL